MPAARKFSSVDATTGLAFGPGLAANGPEDVAEACAAAEVAFEKYRETTPAARVRFLELIGEEIAALGDRLIEMAVRESALPRARIENEIGRTIGQLRLFAATVRQGEWMGLRLDPALLDRLPLPRPDLRLRMIPLGPVAVFGASNFPLAFSAAGGDTASALAAGCPVVLKAHPAHPGTDALVAGAIQAAARSAGMPEGVFSVVTGPDHALGLALVSDPRIAAVAFTGSRAGGLALLRAARERDIPIPVYAEMSSINPVVLMPAALKTRGQALGAAFVASLTMGTGQFCTNPGLILAIEGPGLNDFVAGAVTALEASTAATMLSGGICNAYNRGVAALAAHPAVKTLARGKQAAGFAQCQAAFFACNAGDFLADSALGAEVFGAAALLVYARDADELSMLITSLEGQLTASLHMDAADEVLGAKLLPLLERKAGRIIVNNWPTGVEVTHAMVHGGPYPATSDARSTSVGSLAIDRFLRPVSYQNVPPALLPANLRDDALVGLPHLADGTRDQ
jgi:alpha-ketoglutaric semialdehyde dehydrogenase